MWFGYQPPPCVVGRCRDVSRLPPTSKNEVGPQKGEEQMKATPSSTNASKSAALRARLKHPIVDADGHTVEFEPGVLDYLKDIAGSAAVDRYKSSPDGAFIFPWNHMT